MPETGHLADASPSATEPVVQDFGWALGTVLRAYLKAAAEVVSGVPGGSRGFQVLEMASDGSCRNQAAIAERLAIDRTVMTYLIDDLEAEKLVERRPDPADRRSRQVHLTSKGQKVLAELRERVRKVERHVLSELDDAEVQVLRGLLTRAAVDADAGARPTDACVIAEDLNITG